MNDAQLHLALNHFPILGTLFGTILLGFGLFGKNSSLLKAGLITLFIMAVMTVPVYLTGEGAEEIVEELGVDHDIIHEHEEIAETAVLFTDTLGLLALISFFLSQKTFNRPARILTIVTFVMGVIVFVFMLQVGGSGGEIRHTELREASQ